MMLKTSSKRVELERLDMSYLGLNFYIYKFVLWEYSLEEV